MQDDLQQQIDIRRKTLALKSMHFSRFLFVRYTTAFLFFLFLNWAVAMYFSSDYTKFIPILGLIVILPASVEQISLYSRPRSYAVYTVWSFRIITGLFVLLLCSVFSHYYSTVFPFLALTEKAQLFAAFFLCFLLCLCVCALYKLQKIKHNEDKQYQRITLFNHYLYPKGDML